MAIVAGPTLWQFWTSAPLGSSFGGGRVICKSGGVAWILAPSTTEVSRTWYCRNDVVTTTQSITGCTGWFLPTGVQLQNPGYICRTYWDYYSCCYWSDTQKDPGGGIWINMNTGSTGSHGFFTKCYTLCVRAFRCVTY